MSSIDLVSLVAAITFIVGYAAIMFVLSLHIQKEEYLTIKRRLEGVFKSPTQAELHVSSLIKEPNSEIENYFKSRLPKIEGFTEWLQHAGLEINPVIFAGMSLLFGIIIFLLTFFILRSTILLSMLFGMASSFFLPWVLVTYLTNVQRNKFLQEFPTALDMIQRALRAGHSAERAIEMVATRITGPIGTSFQLISEKMGLGEPPEVVLAEISNRLGIDEFRMLSIVLILQRETGGSLAEAIDNFAKIIRARQNLKKKVKALTGEVRATAMILTSVPFFITGIIYVTSPRYLDTLFYTPTGHNLLLIAGVMLSTGIIIIFRMAYKDVY